MESTSEIDVEQLISLVEERPEIWDKTSELYKCRDKTRDAWSVVCRALNANFEEMDDKEKYSYVQVIMKKWTNIKDSFLKWKKKDEDSKRSGGGKRRKYVYFDQIQFLLKAYPPTETESSLPGTREHLENPCLAMSSTETPEQPSPVIPMEIGSKSGKKVTLKTKKLDEFELRILEVLKKEDDRHMNFFKAIIPTLKTFDEEQTVDFQIGVMEVLRNIQRAKSTMAQPPSLNESFNSQNYFQPTSNQDYVQSPPSGVQCISSRSSSSSPDEIATFEKSG